MTKKKKQKSSKKTPLAKANIQELQESRNGGQIALRGYSYQFLYSCNLILSSSTDTVFTLEGIEDIDTIKCCDGNRTITHIQLKYSSQRQDANFMDDVLKNYLETYLIDKNRYFKLVYDFFVAAGNLSKLFSGNLDKNSRDCIDNEDAHYYFDMIRSQALRKADAEKRKIKKWLLNMRNQGFNLVHMTGMFSNGEATYFVV